MRVFLQECDFVICRQRQRRPDRAVYVPRGRRSQTTPRTSTTTATTHSDDTPATKVSIVASSQSGEIVEFSPQIAEENSKIAIVEQATTDCKEDTVSQQQLDCHSQNGSPTPLTKVDSNETMTEADHINANGSKIDTTLSSCDKDYNEEKEFQRASKVCPLEIFKLS